MIRWGGGSNNIKNGDSKSSIFSKIHKIFRSLTKVAFTGDYNDLINVPNSPSSPTGASNIRVIFQSYGENIKLSRIESDQLGLLMYYGGATNIATSSGIYFVRVAERWGNLAGIINYIVLAATNLDGKQIKVLVDDNGDTTFSFDDGTKGTWCYIGL